MPATGFFAGFAEGRAEKLRQAMMKEELDLKRKALAGEQALQELKLKALQQAMQERQDFGAFEQGGVRTPATSPVLKQALTPEEPVPPEATVFEQGGVPPSAISPALNTPGADLPGPSPSAMSPAGTMGLNLPPRI